LVRYKLIKGGIKSLRKIILIVAALVLVVSGVAAVSAYEAHIVDVKAHVENALGVPAEVDFGINFPQAVNETEFVFGLSNSFVSENQTEFSQVHYVILWESKPIGDHDAIDPDCDGDFEPIWPYVTLSPADANDGLYPAPWGHAPGYVYTAWGVLWKSMSIPGEGDLCDVWNLYFDPPVFDQWYNPTTDPKTPSGILYYTDNDQCDDDYEIVTETVCEQEVLVPHADLGNNLKIQVVMIVPHT
jgi:hypothetical protein